MIDLMYFQENWKTFQYFKLCKKFGKTSPDSIVLLLQGGDTS